METIFNILSYPFVLTGYILNVLNYYSYVFLTQLYATFSCVAYYAFILLCIMLPLMIVVAYLLYKSKPTEQSFTKFQSNFNKLMGMNMRSNSISFPERIVIGLIFNTITNITFNTVIFFDIGIASVAVVDNNAAPMIFLGVMDAWIPIK